MEPGNSHQDFMAQVGNLGPPLLGPPNGAEAAVAVCLAPDTAGMPHVLLIKRAEHPLDPWSGHIGLPGGRRDPGDESVLMTATRETREEVGIALGEGALIGGLPPVDAARPGVPRLVVHPLVFSLDSLRPIEASHEVAAGRWVSLSALTDPRHGTTRSVRSGDRQLHRPGVHIHAPDASSTTDPWLLWGLTYRMLSDLVALAGLELAGGRP